MNQTFILFANGQPQSNSWPAIAAISAVVGVLSSGFVLFVLNWFKESRNFQWTQRLNLVKEQLAKLYGPIHLLLIKNQQSLSLAVKVHDASKKLYGGRALANSELKDVTDAIELQNAYTSTIAPCNSEICKIIQDNWSLIDDDDLDVFSEFFELHQRHQTEFPDGKPRKADVLLLFELGKLPIIDVGLVEHMQRKWKEKRQQLFSLSSIQNKNRAP